MVYKKEKVLELVRGYVERAKKVVKGGLDQARIYPLKEEGLWKVVSGSNDESGWRKDIGFVKGRFIDAVAYAVQQPGFCGWYCSLENMNNPHHGYVKKFVPQKIVFEELDSKSELNELVELLGS